MKKIMKMIMKIIMKIVIISTGLTLFFSLMAGMYYKSAPRNIKITILDEDHTAFSRSLIHAISATDYFKIVGSSRDYLRLKKTIDDGEADIGLTIPHGAWKDVLNKRNVKILTIVNGSANPIIPKMGLMMIGKIIMTFNSQLAMHLRVEDLGDVPNSRHMKKPPLMLTYRSFYNPSLSMESSMLPAFMGLAMQIVSMLIILFMIKDNLSKMKLKIPDLKFARQLPSWDLAMVVIVSWFIVGTSISIAFFTTMHLFGVAFTPHVVHNTVIVIFTFVLSMESIIFFLAMNINHMGTHAALITLIVIPVFMYSGYLIPLEQMADLPRTIGGLFPLRYYLNALYPVFNHHKELSFVAPYLHKLWKFSLSFFGLSTLFLIWGHVERNCLKKKMKEDSELNVITSN